MSTITTDLMEMVSTGKERSIITTDLMEMAGQEVPCCIDIIGHRRKGTTCAKHGDVPRCPRTHCPRCGMTFPDPENPPRPCPTCHLEQVYEDDDQGENEE